jgi:hypothetical protein
MSWVRYDDRWPDHPKVVEAKFRDVGCLSLHQLGGCWSATTTTPGIVTLAAAVAQVGSKSKAQRWAAILVDVRLWHAPDHDCDRCPQPPKGAFVVHDWQIYNPPRDLSEKRSEAGRRGAEARWGSRQGDGKSHGTTDGTPDGKRMAENAPDPVPLTPTTDVVAVVRDDVESLCRHLADLIERNGSKRPTITQRWHDAARLMLDRDDRTFDQVWRAIEWSQADEFWRTNVLSMPTLREKYDQLRLAAQRSSSSSRRPRADLSGAMDRARAAEASA